ncbi:50S ribosomal protein L13 [Blattabacterium cuenoti]|uniref:50S ribosomal protein L13 n=1 Tax=Blattabacterium cuenoti TaxID=1653831 RepID=UPI00163D0FDF|nr:50S ribosomal protein L13 [Blattabacterium cuenoti]
MDPISFKTTSFNKKLIKKSWIIMDATNQVLGRFSSRIAHFIMGKHKSCYSPYINCGDCVIVINSNNIRLTGNKWINKKYIRYTGYPGGKKETNIKNILEKDSRIIIFYSVKRMLPKNKLRKSILRKNLYVYHDNNHKHDAQKPVLIENYY